MSAGRSARFAIITELHIIRAGDKLQVEVGSLLLTSSTRNEDAPDRCILAAKIEATLQSSQSVSTTRGRGNCRRRQPTTTTTTTTTIQDKSRDDTKTTRNDNETV